MITRLLTGLLTYSLTLAVSGAGTTTDVKYYVILFNKDSRRN